MDFTISETHTLESFVALCIGIGLAASCGFRVFVPLLFVSVAARAEYLILSEGFEWLGTWPAIAIFATATVLEIGAYYIPWLDNLLDSAAAPAAVIAGTVVTAACVYDLDPMLQWTLAAIAGGGAAGIVQVGTSAIRTTSSVTTAGLGNFVVSTGELGASLSLSALSIVAPVFAFILVVAGLVLLMRFVWPLVTRWLSPAGQAR